MTPEKHERADQLKALIVVTDNGLKHLIELRDKAAKKPAVGGGNKRNNLYSFHIGEFRDHSGLSADLARYEGNDELLDMIIYTLGRQLDGFKKEYGDL